MLFKNNSQRSATIQITLLTWSQLVFSTPFTGLYGNSFKGIKCTYFVIYTNLMGIFRWMWFFEKRKAP